MELSPPEARSKLLLGEAHRVATWRIKSEENRGRLPQAYLQLKGKLVSKHIEMLV